MPKSTKAQFSQKLSWILKFWRVNVLKKTFPMVISWVSCSMRWACFSACPCPCQVSWLPYSTDSYFHDFVFVSVSYIKKSKLQIWKAQQGNLLMSGKVNTSWSHQWQLRRASCFSHPAGKQPCHHQPHHLQEPEHPGLPLHQHQGAPRDNLLQGAPHTRPT